MGEHGGVHPYTYLFIIGGRAELLKFYTRGGTQKNIMCYFFGFEAGTQLGTILPFLPFFIPF